MDAAHDIPDSTDWLDTPLSGLSALENALHCQICKEFFDTPMITSCSHTFCSKCIRTALSTDGCCPACRTQDQASKLRNNWQLQEVVATFQDARPATIKVAREQQLAATSRPGKRKRVVLDSDNSYSEEPLGRTTRSKSRKVSSQTSQPEAVEIDDDEDETYVEEPVDDGLIECPLGCGQRMKLEQIEPHLDRCEDERIAREKAAQKVKRPPMAGRPQDRLNELNYSMMKEKDLAKKMRDLGIPASGGKQLMVRRHTAWVNIWNANCDSSNPRTKRELLRELDTWERTQGGSAPNVSNSIMKKDFDGNGWMKKNETDFSRLIADARRTKSKAAEQKKDDAVNGTAPSGEAEDLKPSASIAAPVDLTQSAQLNTVSHDFQGDQEDHMPPSQHDPTSSTPETGLDLAKAHSEHEQSFPFVTSQQTPTRKKVPMFAVPSESMDGIA